jgi:hypothetical protein
MVQVWVDGNVGRMLDDTSQDQVQNKLAWVASRHVQAEEQREFAETRLRCAGLAEDDRARTISDYISAENSLRTLAVDRDMCAPKPQNLDATDRPPFPACLGLHDVELDTSVS